jgi:zinc transporter 7
MVGFVTFVAMDKGLRSATGGEGHGHDHGGSGEAVKPVGSSSALEGSNGKSAKSRKKGNANGHAEVVVAKEEKEINASVKLAGYLNLM